MSGFKGSLREGSNLALSRDSLGVPRLVDIAASLCTLAARSNSKMRSRRALIIISIKGNPCYFGLERTDSLSLVGHGDTGLSSLLKVPIRLGYDRIRHLLFYLLTELLNY